MSLVVLSALLPIALFISLNLRRARRSPAVHLVPNCLLTRYPICFVHGRPSPFYFSRYWNAVPRYLSEHGYEVTALDGRAPDRLTAPAHLILDASTRLPDSWRAANAEFIRSVTVIGGGFEPEGPEPTCWSALLRLHALWRGLPVAPKAAWLGVMGTEATHEGFLKHAISLAEQDLKCSH